MKIATSYRRLGEDTQGDHIEVHTVYTGSKDEIDALEDKMRVSIGDGTFTEIPEEM